eukprot:g13509.t1
MGGKKCLGSWKTVGPDVAAAELLKIDDDDDEAIVPEHLHANIVEVWNGGKMKQAWEDATIRVTVARFSQDEVVMSDLVYLKEDPGAGGEGSAGPRIGVTVSARKTKTLVMRVKEQQQSSSLPPPLIIEAGGQSVVEGGEGVGGVRGAVRSNEVYGLLARGRGGGWLTTSNQARG